MIKVLFFGVIADRVGQHTTTLTASKTMTLAEVVRAVGCEPFHPLLLAINQEQVQDMTTPIKANDEVAIMPPFSGG